MATLNTDTLRARFAGRLFLAEDPEYDQARSVFNVMHAKRPAVIARCTRTSDVAAAVDFARQHRLVVAVRSAVTVSPVWAPAMMES